MLSDVNLWLAFVINANPSQSNIVLARFIRLHIKLLVFNSSFLEPIMLPQELDHGQCILEN